MGLATRRTLKGTVGQREPSKDHPSASEKHFETPAEVNSQNGRRCSSRRQEGTSQVQAEDRSYFQEQGAKTRTEGIRRRDPRHGGSGHRHHGGLSLGGLRGHGAQRLGQIRNCLALRPRSYRPSRIPTSDCAAESLALGAERGGRYCHPTPSNWRRLT